MTIAIDNIVADNVRINGINKTVHIDFAISGMRWNGDVTVRTDRAGIDLGNFDREYMTWIGNDYNHEEFKRIVNQIDASAREAVVTGTVREFFDLSE